MSSTRLSFSWWGLPLWMASMQCGGGGQGHQPCRCFLWLRYLERLAWQKIYNRRKAGGLGVSCIATTEQALSSKQLCHQVCSREPQPLMGLLGWTRRLATISRSCPRSPHALSLSLPCWGRRSPGRDFCQNMVSPDSYDFR
jgi:hypothetical protein